MSVIRDLRFFFSGWNWGLLGLIAFALAAFIFVSLNAAISEEEKVSASVVSVGLTHSDYYNSSHANARIRLPDGKEVDVILPRNVMYEPSDEFVILKQRHLFGCISYRYYGDLGAQ